MKIIELMFELKNLLIKIVYRVNDELYYKYQYEYEYDMNNNDMNNNT